VVAATTVRQSLLPALLECDDASRFHRLLTGWYTSEIGRQPWVVYGVLCIINAASLAPASTVLTSLIVYFVTCMILLGFGSGYLYRVLHHGPESAPERVRFGATASRPLAAVDQGKQE
jgi:cytochrome d ubiquinol oxidase subunit I